MKKVLSVVLALMLVVAMAAPAFATDTNKVIEDPSKLGIETINKVTGTTSVGVLKVTVPTSNAVILNPYALSLKVTAAGAEDSTNGTAVTDQIISPAQAIKSESTSKIKVSAVATGMSGGDVKFATASLASDTTTTTKSVFLELVAAAPGTSDVAAGSELTKITKATGVALGSRASAKTDLGTLDSGATTAQYLQFQLQGDAVKSPASPWTTRDTVGAQIAFTFDLVSDAAAGGGGGGGGAVTATITEASGKTSIATGETASLTVALSGGKTIDSVVWSADDSGANVSLGGSTSATETVSHVSAGGSVTITATVTYDGTQTATASFTLGTT